MRQLEIIKYKPEHMIKLCKSTLVEGGIDNPADVEKWANSRFKDGPAYTGMYNGRIVGCGGVSIYWAGVGQAWAVFPKWVTIFKREAYCYIKKGLNIIITEYDMRRIEATWRTDYPDKMHWLEHLGFQREGLLRKYCPDGCDAWMYAYIV